MSDKFTPEKVYKALEILTIVEEYIEEQDITCAEIIHQTDEVLISAPGLIKKLCDIVGYKDT